MRGIGFLAVEDCVDRLQRPGLVQNDPIPEQVRLIEHHPEVVQKREQTVRRLYSSVVLAEVSEFLLG